MDGSSDASALLGIDGFVVLASTEEAGEFFVLVETRRTATGCPECGVVAQGHGRSVVQVRDLPFGGRPVRLLWRKRRFICPEPECPKGSFTDALPVELMKEEQERITRELAEIERRLAAADATLDQVESTMRRCLDFLTNCYQTYVTAPVHVRRMLNQAMFEAFYVGSDDGQADRVVLAVPTYRRPKGARGRRLSSGHGRPSRQPHLAERRSRLGRRATSKTGAK